MVKKRGLELKTVPLPPQGTQFADEKSKALTVLYRGPEPRITQGTAWFLFCTSRTPTSGGRAAKVH